MSRITKVIEQVEQGEPVDWRRVSTLLALDAVLADEAFVAENNRMEREADERLAEWLAE